MQIVKKLMKSIGQYRLQTIMTPVFTFLEVLMEILIPYIIHMIVTRFDTK